MKVFGGQTKRLQRLLLGMGALALVGYLALCTTIYLIQETYLFHPTPEVATPAQEGLPTIEVANLSTPDGETLVVWQQKAQGNQPTILYFHGNARSLSARSPRFAQILAADFGLFAPAYRGYSGSSGMPSESALFADALLAFDELAKRTTGPIIVYGESLGTGVALYVAEHREAAAVILEAPYLSVLQRSREAMPWLPVDLLLKHPFRSDLRVGRVEEPLLILHGTSDKVIPFKDGQALFELGTAPKHFEKFEGGEHGNLWALGSFNRVRDFLRKSDIIP